MKLSSLVIISSVLFSASTYATAFPFAQKAEYQSKHAVMEVTPGQSEGTKFDFIVNGSIDMYACEVSGTAYITERDNNQNTWSAVALPEADSASGETVCRVDFTQEKSGRIFLKTNFGCAGYCGMGAVGAMDGVYKKTR